MLSPQFGQDLIEEVVNDTGVREKRKRLLPAHVMIRYVIAMGLFFEESYEEVMRRLVGSRPTESKQEIPAPRQPETPPPHAGSTPAHSRPWPS